MSDLLIRPAGLDDLPRLSAIWHEHAVLLSQQDSRWVLRIDAPVAWQSAAEKMIADPSSVLLVAAEDDVLVGFVGAVVQRGPVGFAPEFIGIINQLVVDAHRFSAGAARELVDGARDWLKGQGVTQVIAQVPRRAAIDQAFWRAQGGVLWMESLWIRS